MVRRTRSAATRRSFLQTSAAFLAAGARASGQTPTPTSSEWEVEALAAIPFEHVVVPGAMALTEWESLRRPGVSPVIFDGLPEELSRFAEPFDPDFYPPPSKPPELADTLAKAGRIRFPKDLRELRATEAAEAFERRLRYADDPAWRTRVKQWSEQQLLGASLFADRLDPPVGEWPDDPPTPSDGYTPPLDHRTGGPAAELLVFLLPTDDPTTIPAQLRWGGWNRNPRAEHHVAALRNWRDRYGAELVAATGDSLELRVARRPTTRQQAVRLAREHYWYCEETLDGDAGLMLLAAALMESDWWFFWWD